MQPCTMKYSALRFCVKAFPGKFLGLGHQGIARALIAAKLAILYRVETSTLQKHCFHVMMWCTNARVRHGIIARFQSQLCSIDDLMIYGKYQEHIRMGG